VLKNGNRKNRACRIASIESNQEVSEMTTSIVVMGLRYRILTQLCIIGTDFLTKLFFFEQDLSSYYLIRVRLISILWKACPYLRESCKLRGGEFS